MKITGLDLLNKLRFSKVSSVTGIYETEDVTIHGEKIHVLKFIDSDEFEIKKEPAATDSIEYKNILHVNFNTKRS